MNSREFFERVIEMVGEGEVADFAKAELTKMDNRNTWAKTVRESKNKEKNAEFIAKMTELLKNAEKPMLASEIAENLGVSTSKVSAHAPRIEGVKVEDVKVKGVGTRKAFSL